MWWWRPHWSEIAPSTSWFPCTKIFTIDTLPTKGIVGSECHMFLHRCYFRLNRWQQGVDVARIFLLAQQPPYAQPSFAKSHCLHNNWTELLFQVMMSRYIKLQPAHLKNQPKKEKDEGRVRIERNTYKMPSVAKILKASNDLLFPSGSCHCVSWTHCY